MTEIWQGEYFQSHPLVNTATLVLSKAELERFFTLTGHTPKFFKIRRKSKMKIAFAGTGDINKVHARGAQSLGLELVAAVNHKPESMAEFGKEFDITRQYETVEAMFKDGGVDALVVSTPNYLHASQTIAALNAGVHVMVEKPMAMNATGSRANVRSRG